MTTYDFGYYTKRAEILSEMARTSKTLTGPAGAKISQFIKEIGNITRKGGEIVKKNLKTGEVEGTEEVPGIVNGLQNKIYRYLVDFIGEWDDIIPPATTGKTKDDTVEVYGVDVITKIAMMILGFPGERSRDHGWDSMEAMRLAIAKWAKENEEVVLSPEFEKAILDPNNILHSMKYARTPSNASGKLKMNAKVDQYGMPIEEIDRIKSRVHPFLTRIHLLKRNEDAANTRMQRKGKVRQQKNVKSISNNYTENIDNVLDILDTWIVEKSKYSMLVKKYGNLDSSDMGKLLIEFNKQFLNSKLTPKELGALPSLIGRDDTLLEDLYDFFSEFESNGISMEDFQSEIDSVKNVSSPQTHAFLDYLVREIYKITPEVEGSKYPDYDLNILKQVLTTPESQKAFDEWYQRIHIPDLETDKKNVEIKKGGLMTSKNETENLNAGINRLDDAAKKRQDAEDRIKKMEDSMESGEYSDEEDDPYKESSYIMGYMTEQINKDKFSPRGEFKDRGFKKATYHQWLLKNQ